MGVAAITSDVGEASVRKPGDPTNGDVHSRPARSRALTAANVAFARNAAIPPRSSPRATIVDNRAAWVWTPARR